MIEIRKVIGQEILDEFNLEYDSDTNLGFIRILTVEGDSIIGVFNNQAGKIIACSWNKITGCSHVKSISNLVKKFPSSLRPYFDEATGVAKHPILIEYMDSEETTSFVVITRYYKDSAEFYDEFGNLGIYSWRIKKFLVLDDEFINKSFKEVVDNVEKN